MVRSDIRLENSDQDIAGCRFAPSGLPVLHPGLMNYTALAWLSILIPFAGIVGCGEPELPKLSPSQGQGRAASVPPALVPPASVPPALVPPASVSPASFRPASFRPASFRSGTAEEFLKTVFDGYRTATSYHDRGRVRLTTTENGKRVERAAPMSMWMLRTDVDLVAYDVRITIEKSILEAWVADPASDDMDSQVLHVPLPLRRGRPSLDAALTDPILAGRLGAGLAGPPPQLEWLFAKDPMPGLFRGDHQFQFLVDQRIDDRLCRCIRVIVPEDKSQSEYRFFVDAESQLIRQVDLPTVTLPDSQGKPTQATISIELSSASFRPPSRRRVRAGFPTSPVRVKRFVPVPLPPPSKSSDVPSELRDQWDEQVQQYQAALNNVRL